MPDIDYSELTEDIKSQTDKIVMQVKETEENFIFQTLKPYSENIVEREVSKKELSRAIINYFNPTTPACKDNLIKCSNCYTSLFCYPGDKVKGLDYIYCYKCGRRMKIK